MTGLSTVLTTILAASSTVAVYGINQCIADTACSAGDTYLYFNGCSITDADLDDLGTCFDSSGRSNIERLYILNNEVTAFPPDFFKDMSALRILQMYGNDLTTFDAAVFKPMTSSLEYLTLNSNQLTSLPSGVFAGMGSLIELHLYSNQLTNLPSDIFDDLAKMEKMILYGNELTTLPSGVFSGMGALLELDLHTNHLATLLSGTFTGLDSLESLNLGGTEITTLPSGSFAGLDALKYLYLTSNEITTLSSGSFAGMGSLSYLYLRNNQLTTLSSDVFDDVPTLQVMVLSDNPLNTLPSGIFDGLAAMETMYLRGTELITLPSDVFADMGLLVNLHLSDNELMTLPSDAFAGLAELEFLYLHDNILTAFDVDLFNGLESLRFLNLDNNELTTLPAGVFEDLGSGTSLQYLVLTGNPDLQCVPTNFASGSTDSTATFDTSDYTDEVITAGLCECTPTDVATCDDGFSCSPGTEGYTCDADTVCVDHTDCDTDAGEECCLVKLICEVPDATDPGACGDPHMTGFRGQKFDFTGEDGGWYAVVSNLPYMHLNMRVTAPVPSLPEITYITGISVSTTDADGVDHSIVISVKEPHSMDSACPIGMASCLADGALHVVVDGEEVMLTPDTFTIAPDVAMAAVNLPGACRSFGFEQYWERKKLEYLAQPDRKLDLVNGLQDMSEWVLADPTATNMVECTDYVARVTAAGDIGLFNHQSEHVSFQIMTPTTTIRLSHGRLHQLPMRDPTDQYDLPDHLAWQMNLAIDQSDMSLDASGILGETLVPTLDEAGAPIMHGMAVIRGAQEDYRVSGPLEVFFAQDQRQEE